MSLTRKYRNSVPVCDSDCAAINHCRVGGYKCPDCGMWFCPDCQTEGGAVFCDDCAKRHKAEADEEDENEETR